MIEEGAFVILSHPRDEHTAAEIAEKVFTTMLSYRIRTPA